MRLLHTADWHLGKTLKGQSLIDDQKFILDEIFKIIDEQKPDAILIAGDIYDRAIPPAEAVELFNETLNRFAEKNLPTLIIAGNHDSAARLNFGSKLFESRNIFIASKISEKPRQIVLEDEFGEVYFSMIPYLEADKVPAYLALAREQIPARKRSVALAHIFLAGGVESDSERKFVGGAENVSADIFSDYNWVALGHLHRPQKFYSGSPLKYSFDEADHKKSVTIVELDGAGNVKTDRIPLKPRRDLIVVEGQFSELINRPPCNDYAQIILTDDFYVYETEKLRDAFPNFLEIRRKNHLQSYDDAPPNSFSKEDSISEQFAKFFKDVTNEPLNCDEQTAFEEFLRELDVNEREA